MFLIQIDKHLWVDGEKIDAIWIHGKKLKLSLTGGDEESFIIGDDFKNDAINHINMINESVNSIKESKD